MFAVFDIWTVVGGPDTGRKLLMANAPEDEWRTLPRLDERAGLIYERYRLVNDEFEERVLVYDPE